MSNLAKYGLGTFCSGVVEYSLRDPQARTSVCEAGYWVVKGAIVNYLCIKDLCNGNIKKGLLKGALGTIFIANGVLKLAVVVTNANELQCAVWPQSLDGLSQSVSLQPCNAFECRPTLTMKLHCS